MNRRVDQSTLDAARRGDKTAQAQLLRVFGDLWYRLSLGLIGHVEDARDATQETALRVLRDLSKFRGDSSISTWSIGIAINVAREIRRRTRRARTESDCALDAIPIDNESADESAYLDESRSMLRDALDELSDRQREAVILRFFEQLSVDEAAHAMGCAAGTVKATVHQALRVLKGKLKQLA